jgi:hypothetical protein
MGKALLAADGFEAVNRLREMALEDPDLELLRRMRDALRSVLVTPISASQFARDRFFAFSVVRLKPPTYNALWTVSSTQCPLGKTKYTL